MLPIIQTAQPVAKIQMMKTFPLLLISVLHFSNPLFAHFNESTLAPCHRNCTRLTSIFSIFQTHPEYFQNTMFGDFRVRKVVIDAGHGGKDSGCLGSGSQEKHIALSIALKLGESIKLTHPDVAVIYTRDKDIFIPLHKRAEIANKNNADLFISIHCNYIPNASHIKGAEVYVMGLHTSTRNLEVAKRENEVIFLEEDYEKNYGLDPNSPEGHILLSAYQHAHLEQSILFAGRVDQHIKKRNNHSSRSVLQAGFFVLRETTMPSVLVETGYLSNRNDEAFLLSENGQNEIVLAMLNAFNDYREILESGKNMADVDKKAYSDTNVVAMLKKNAPVNHSASVVKADPSTKKTNVFESTASPGTKILADPEPMVVSASLPATPKTSTDVEFRVQLAASKTALNMNEPSWKNVGYPIAVVTEDGLQKYQALRFENYAKAQQAQQNLGKNGFNGAFIVAYKNSKKIPLQEARKLTE